LLATDLLPFAIVSELVGSVLPQLQAEKELQTYQALKRSLERDEFSAVLENTVCAMGSQNVKQDSRHLFESISNYLLDKTWENFSPLFGLSSDEEGQVQSVISRVNAFDPRVLIRYQKRIDNSLEKSKEIRARLQASSIENVESYMQTLSTLEEEVKIAILKKDHAQEILALKKSDLDQKESNLRSLKKAFEEQLKVHSVSAVSGKTLLLLEDLQNTLYSNLIQRVESDLNRKFQELIRKKNFFSRIYIDKSFTVHILRNERINKIDLLSLLRTGSFSVATSALGDVAIASLRERYSVDSAIELRETLSAETVEQISLPVEISKDRLSSGEKQIFVMSLYWAIMNQSKNELPFIIDTPFARIDAEHRSNITEYFFKKLTGQLLILSTDEELSNNHLEAMRDQISHVYMLEYGQDKRTHIRENQYFEV
jgi:DNA sulfur modification protein DndD